MEQRELHVRIGERWRVDGIGAGRWALHASGQEAGRHWSSEALEAETRPGAETKGLTLRLVEYGVEGIVRDRRGYPVAGATVHVQWQRTEDPFGASVAGAASRLIAGRTGLSLVSGTTGDHIVLTEADRVVTELIVPEYEAPTVEAPDFAGLEIESGEVEVGGWASLENVPLLGSNFQEPEGTLARRNAVFWAFASELQDFDVENHSTVTDSAGRYVLGLPGPGTYGLAVSGEEPKLLSEPAEVQVDALRPFALQDFEVVRASRIVGRLSLSNGDSAGGMDCFLRTGDDSRNVEADEDGWYEFDDVWPGRHLFYARGGGERGQDWSDHAELEIPEGEEVRFDALLHPSFEAAGSVLLEDGRPAEGARVLAVGANNDHLTREALVGPDGRFTLRGLYPSEYAIQLVELELVGQHGFFVDHTSPPDYLELVARPREPEDDSDPR